MKLFTMGVHLLARALQHGNQTFWQVKDAQFWRALAHNNKQHGYTVDNSRVFRSRLFVAQP